jgi:hypothetical protein
VPVTPKSLRQSSTLDIQLRVDVDVEILRPKFISHTSRLETGKISMLLILGRVPSPLKNVSFFSKSFN